MTEPSKHDWVIRPYHEDDWEAVYGICVRTGDAGEDVSGRFPDDNIFPDIWAGPYLRLEPESAFILEERRRAVGYVLGTADTASFVKRYRTEWLPVVGGHYPTPTEPPETPEQRLVSLLWHPETMLIPELHDYPAHLHIDILHGYRGGGAGRKLIEAFTRGTLRKGAGGVHVGVSSTNIAALGFYRKLASLFHATTPRSSSGAENARSWPGTAPSVAKGR
jgi:ribosomal protein S18 acetylase RimI-like enzyme